jgi:hypothetical protein
MYGAHAACQHAPGVRCHFLSHFDCGEEEDLEEADFEAHPKDVIPAAFVGRGSFWWYAHVTHFLLQVSCAFDLLRPVSAANPVPPTPYHQAATTKRQPPTTSAPSARICRLLLFHPLFARAIASRADRETCQRTRVT